jgi:long-chain acyl-CoA synthetase
MSDSDTSLEEGHAETHPLVERILEASDAEDFEPITDISVPQLLLENARSHPDEVALRQKRHGIWKELTWSEYFEQVAAVAAGMEGIGFGRGDIVYTIGYNRPQQLWTWLGAHILGGKAAPEYEGALPDEMLQQIELLEPSLVYAEDQEMVDKLLRIIDDAPWIDAVIYNDPKGVENYDPPEVDLFHFDELVANGRAGLDDDVTAAGSEIATLIKRVDPTEVAMLPPTSGTTGPSKRVKITHTNYLNLARSTAEIYDIQLGTDYFSFLPMAWGGEQMIVLSAALQGRWVVNYAEEPETEADDFREIGPEVMISSPNRYEEHVADVKARIENSTPLKRWTYRKAMIVGERYAKYVSGDRKDESPPAWLTALHFVCYWLVYRPILDKMGLKMTAQVVDRSPKLITTGGGPLGEEHFTFFHSLGVPLKQLWGQTETCGFVTIHREDYIQAPTVGEPIPGIEVGLSPAGELLVRGPMVTEGYYNQPEKTEEALEDGWLHTDDFGEMTDDGHVIIKDRMDDVMELADGTTVAPVQVETKLKFNPYVENALVVGEGQEHLAAVLNIRFDNVAEWADQRDIQYTGYRDLVQKPKVLEMLAEHIRETNEELKGVRIHRFVSLFKKFDPDDGEVTRTGKIRREVVVERYSDLVDAIWSGTDETDLDLTITYQDGQETRIHGTARIVSVDHADREPGVQSALQGGE